MTLEKLIRALQARAAGRGWTARCPAHDDRTPSLSITESLGKILVHCHAGCPQDQVIDRLRSMGLWPEPARAFSPMTRSGPRQRSDTGRHDSNRTLEALRLWSEAQPAIGSLVEVYLQSRHITLPPPASLRFHRSLWHPDGDCWPAMVALVTDGKSGTPRAIHRTYLARDGRGKAPVASAKMMLGPCKGGAVRLAEPEDLLMVGEGIETALSAMQARRCPAWAALSTSGLVGLELPAHVKSVTILADGDDGGEKAAQSSAYRWKREGRHVRIARPPKGMDFNDLLQSANLMKEAAK